MNRHLSPDYDMPAGYDNWKLATPFDGSDDGCCPECNGDDVSDCCGASRDDDIGICLSCKEHCDAAGCGDDDCSCHNTAEDWKEAKGEAKYEADRDDQLTGE